MVRDLLFLHREEEEEEKEEEEKAPEGSSSSVDIPVVQQTHSVLLGPGAVLWQGRCARVVQRQVRGSMVPKTVVVPQLHFIDGRRHPLSFRRSRSSWSSLFSGSLRFRSCRSFFGGRCPCCAGRAGFHPYRAAEADSHGQDCSADHSCSTVAVHVVVDVPVQCCRALTVEIPQVQFQLPP